MPDGTVVESREQRFAFNAAAAREFAEQTGHLWPTKADRPRGVSLYVWLQNQTRAWQEGTLTAERRAAR